MTTIVNTPASTTDSNDSTGMIIGFILLMVLLFVFFVYGLPMMRQSSTPQVNVPDKVDVNINQPQ